MVPSEISVIIPVRDRPQQLERALRSLETQLDHILEILVVDDGSVEPPTAALEPFRHFGSRLALLTNNHSPGAPGARNTGIDAANGSYMSFLDSDDVWLPHHLRTAMSRFSRNPNLICVTGDFTSSNSNSRRRPRSNLGSIDDVALLLRLGHGDPTTSALTVRRTVPPIYFDENLEALQDYDYLIQVASKGVVASTGCTSVVKFTEAERVWNPERAARARQYLRGKWASELDAIPFARRSQRWHLSYERALVDAFNSDLGFSGAARRWPLKIRSRIARDVVKSLRNIPI